MRSRLHDVLLKRQSTAQTKTARITTATNNRSGARRMFDACLKAWCGARVGLTRLTESRATCQLQFRAAEYGEPLRRRRDTSRRGRGRLKRRTAAIRAVALLRDGKPRGARILMACGLIGRLRVRRHRLVRRYLLRAAWLRQPVPAGRACARHEHALQHRQAQQAANNGWPQAMIDAVAHRQPHVRRLGSGTPALHCPIGSASHTPRAHLAIGYTVHKAMQGFFAIHRRERYANERQLVAARRFSPISQRLD